MARIRKTSRQVAALAGRLLASPHERARVKTLAASALAQRGDPPSRRPAVRFKAGKDLRKRS